MAAMLPGRSAGQRGRHRPLAEIKSPRWST